VSWLIAPPGTRIGEPGWQPLPPGITLNWDAYGGHPDLAVQQVLCPLSARPCERDCEDSPGAPQLAGLCERLGFTPMTRILRSTGLPFQVPDPVRGGTFLYCPWNEREVLSGGRVSHHFCGIKRVGWATGSRFRTLKAYQRHWRKQHGR
jgi:hypothetical protein